MFNLRCFEFSGYELLLYLFEVSISFPHNGAQGPRGDVSDNGIDAYISERSWWPCQIYLKRTLTHKMRDTHKVLFCCFMGPALALYSRPASNVNSRALPPECWYYRHASPHPAYSSKFTKDESTSHLLGYFSCISVISVFSIHNNKLRGRS